MTENNELSAGLLAEKNNNEKLEERLTKYEEMHNVMAGDAAFFIERHADFRGKFANQFTIQAGQFGTALVEATDLF